MKGVELGLIFLLVGLTINDFVSVDHRSCWTEGDYVYLQDLYAEPSIRGKRVGRAPIEHVYAHASEQKAASVW